VGCYTGSVVDGRYEIGAVLGQGGMGVVYAARHVVIDKRCAIKILRSEVASDPDIAERFLQEAKAASSIGNPHIIDISDFGRFPDGTTYFVMEYLDGQPLSALIKDHGAIPAARIIHIARQIASGLAAAHDRGIVHRDLKPDNIMLSMGKQQSDFVKILDFGIAKVSAGPRVTVAGRLFGTPYYMSPEQAGGGAVDCRTDVYALGVIMYEMASGRVPFDGDTLMGILTQHIYQKPVPPRELVGSTDLPPGLEGIILKALAKEAAQRYQSMQELTRDLELMASGASPTLPLVERPGAFAPNESQAGRGMALPVPATPRERPRWGVYAALAATVLAGALVVVGLSRGRASSGRPVPDRLTAAPASVSVATQEPARDTEPTRKTQDDTANVVASAPPASAASDRPTSATTAVVFGAEPLDAHVFRGRDDLGSTPLTLDVDKRAPQVLDVRAPGYKPARVKVDGSRQRVTVKLLPIRRKGTAPRKATVDAANGIVNPWGK